VASSDELEEHTVISKHRIIVYAYLDGKGIRTSIMGEQLNNQDVTTEDSNNEWCQVTETILMLALAIAQIRVSMTDGTNSVGTLTESFTQMAENGQALQNLAQKLSVENITETTLNDIVNGVNDVNKQVGDATVAFQFYDRLCQRLSHVCDSLQNLGGLISEADRRHKPNEWGRLKQEIGSSYTMECERIMFEHILQGASIEEALDTYKHHFEKEDTQDETDDEIELF